jgi:hypothetical protein
MIGVQISQAAYNCSGGEAAAFEQNRNCKNDRALRNMSSFIRTHWMNMVRVVYRESAPVFGNTLRSRGIAGDYRKIARLKFRVGHLEKFSPLNGRSCTQQATSVM